MENMTDEEITYIFRRRIQAQALCHLVGQGVAGHIVQRFRKAGTWDMEIEPNTPEDLLPILGDPSHEGRLQLPDGPLIAVQGETANEIIDVKEHLLSMDVALRRAAAGHFVPDSPESPTWVSPYSLQLLQETADDLASSDESTWIEAGLKLHEAISNDFRSNCAGVRQTTRLRYNEGYQQYLNSVFRPDAKCFEHDRPPIWNPLGEADLIRNRITELSSFNELGDALSSYVEFCGYLPLAGELSAAALITAWEHEHPSADVWSLLWDWRESSSTALADYHIAHSLLENPRWIRIDAVDRLVSRAVSFNVRIQTVTTQRPRYGVCALSCSNTFNITSRRRLRDSTAESWLRPHAGSPNCSLDSFTRIPNT